MNTLEKIVKRINTLPEPKKIEVLDFVEYLNQKMEKEETKAWNSFSLQSAMKGMENKEELYSTDDIKETSS